MNEIIRIDEQVGLIYLCACVLHNEPPKADVISRIDIESVWEFAKYHKLSAILSVGLKAASKNLELSWDKDLREIIEKEYASNYRRNLLFSAERQIISRKLDERKIGYTYLKGIIIQNLYPCIGMREMADNDILIDENRHAEVMKIMKEQGYSVMSYGRGVHDTYVKKPFFNFEIHRKLFNEGAAPEISHYFQGKAQQLDRVSKLTYESRMNDNDFYVYAVVHAYKHYESGGTGIRTLMDNYIIRRSEKLKLDRQFIEVELEKLDLLSFENRLIHLSEVCFSKPENILIEEVIRSLDHDEIEMFHYMADAGSYGTMRNVIQNRMKEQFGEQKQYTFLQRFQYISRRIIPTYEWMKKYYPIVGKYPIVTPGVYVFRIFRGAIVNGKKLCLELKSVLRSRK